MKFNSVEFLVFFVAAFVLLWRTSKSLSLNNWILLIASYIFYGWWDYRFLFLMFISSLVDFAVGYYIPKSKHKKLLIAASLVVNLGLLMFFKYFNFFIESTQDALNAIGFASNLHVLQIILPVGISFYTFQTLSYSLDVYKGRIKSEHNFISFLNYVSFFPQLVAGPIERASSFLPQFRKARVFNYSQAVDGLRLFLYGFFKKMVLADNIGLRVDAIYANPENYSTASLIAGCMLFFVQLYADFSAYTDIARGVAKILGFELIKNFKTPLFSKSIPEFWARWHISLTTWFRDYLFIWLAGLNRNSTVWRIIATIILFLVIGFWHGANYTFILFGLLMGLYFIPRILARKNKPIREALNFLNTNIVASKFAMLFTYILLSLTGVLFRSPNISHAWNYYGLMFQSNTSALDGFTLEILPMTVLFLVYEWFMQHKDHPFDVSDFAPWLRRTLYVFMILAILLYGYFGKEPFYYFQF
jgi:alginate O-acetyltransferase complex protein AlgI